MNKNIEWIELEAAGEAMAGMLFAGQHLRERNTAFPVSLGIGSSALTPETWLW
jgi:hypothetical protein